MNNFKRLLKSAIELPIEMLVQKWGTDCTWSNLTGIDVTKIISVDGNRFTHYTTTFGSNPLCSIKESLNLLTFHLI